MELVRPNIGANLCILLGNHCCSLSGKLLHEIVPCWSDRPLWARLSRCNAVV